MKNLYKISILLIIGLLLIIPDKIQSQNDSFIYMEGDKFMLECDEFYPVVMAYPISINKDINGDFHIAPSLGYCPWVQECDTSFSCGIDSLSWAIETRQQIDTLAAMGFNLIRLNGLSVEYKPTATENEGLFSEMYYAQEDPNCLYSLTRYGGYEIIGSTFLRQAKLMREFVEIIRDHNNDYPDKPLRITILTGVGHMYHENQMYINFLEYIADYFKDEPLVFSYEIQSEPVYFDPPQFQVNNKYEKANYFGEWYYAMKEIAPHQFITFGATRYDVLNWDAEAFPVDYINLHYYPQQEYEYSGNTIERYKSAVKWFADSYTKPWIIGETSIAADNDTHYNINDLIVTEADQEEYASNALQYSKHYGASGFTWWVYKGFFWYKVNDTTPLKQLQENFYGLVKRGSTLEECKSAGKNVFPLYNPSISCDTCNNLDSSIYYNFFGLDDVAAYGTVEDENGFDVENAYISAWGEKVVNDDKLTRLYFTFSDSAGNYEINRDPDYTIYKINATFPGMTVHQKLPDSAIVPGVTKQIDFHIEPLNPSLLPEPLVFNDTLIIETGQTITWDKIKAPNETYIAIDSGAKLIIEDTVYVKPETKIVVERGGELELDNGAIIGMCMWKGIEVWGTKSLPPTSVGAHGVVLMKNESVIENAVYGIRTIKTSTEQTEGEDLDYNHSGGHVIVQGNSIFKNCKFGVQFYPYSYDHTSQFSDAIFEVDDELINPNEYPVAGAYLEGVKGIEFKGCTFINSRDMGDIDPDDRGKGIRSIESHYTVEEYCSGQSLPCPDSLLTPCRFVNLYYGIDAGFTTSNKFIDVQHAEFTNNWRGLQTSAMTGGRITSNAFDINEDFVTNGGCGMYLNNCTGYWVEENTFAHVGDTATGIGLVVHNSGSAANEIYRNYFENLEQGISAQGQNKNTKLRNRGLQILCNDFDVCDADIFVPMAPVPHWGIAPNQGVANSTDPEDMAGNDFYYGTITLYDDINNQADGIDYYYDNNLIYNVKPEDYFGVDLEDINTDPDWTPENGCPSQISQGGGGLKSSGLSYREQLEYYSELVESTEATLTALIDGGDTETLNTEVELSIPPETMEIYTELLNESPYLSETVVESAIEKETVLPNAMVRDIMVANPQSANSDQLIEKLDDRITPMPDYMKAQILQGKSIISQKQELESQLANYKLKQTRAINGLVREYLADTISPETASDSIVALYETVNDINIKYRLAMLHLQRGEYTEGSTTMNEILTAYDLRTDEIAEHNDVVEYFNLVKGIKQDNRTELDATGDEVQDLLNIEQFSNGITGAYARNVLVILEEIEYLAPIQLPDLNKSSKKVEELLEVMNSKPPSRLSAFPNPSKDYVIVEYHLETEKDGVVEVKNINGIVVEQARIEWLQDQVTINTSRWKPGTYIATLIIDGKSLESIKFTLIK